MQPDTHALRLLVESDRLPSGSRERALIDEAISIADAIGNDELAYAGRLRLASSAAFTGDSTTRLSAFEWCLERHLADPLRYPAQIDDLDLLWEFIQIPAVMCSSPRFEAATIGQALSELRTVFARQGQSMVGVLRGEALVARAMGRTDDLDAIHRRSATLAPDDYAACAVCAQGEEAVDLAQGGRREAAIRQFDAILDSGLSCAHEPENSLAWCLLPYLRSGEMTRAQTAHRLGYNLVRTKPRYLRLVAHHIRFCAVTANLTLGLTLVRRHLPWLASDPLDSASRFEALLAIAGLLERVCANGGNDTVIRGADSPALLSFFGPHVGEWSARDLASACWHSAAQIGRAFDSRNGTPAFERQLADERALLHETYPLILAETHSAVEGRLPPNPLPDDLGAASPAHALTSDQWLELARERASTSDEAGAHWAIQCGHAAVDAEGVAAPPTARVDLYALEIRLSVDLGDLDLAEKILRWRVDELLDHTRFDLADVERRLGLLLFGVMPQARQGELERELDEARRARLDPEAQTSILLALGSLRLLQGRAPDAEGYLLEATRLCGHDPDDPAVTKPLLLLAEAQLANNNPSGARAALDRLLRFRLDRAFRARALLLRARALDTNTDRVRAIEDADRALSLYFDLASSSGVIGACTLLASLLEAQGIRVGVVEAWRLAATEAADTDHPDLTALRFRLARALIAADEGTEAVTRLDEVFTDLVQTGTAPGELAETLFWLGHAQRQCDDEEGAYCTWSLALTLVPVTDARASVRLNLSLGRLLLDNDDPASVDVLTEAVNQARRLTDSPWELVDALHLLGTAHCRFGAPLGLTCFDEALDLAGQHAFDIDGLVATVTESRAHALDALGDAQAALAASSRASRLYERLGDRASAGHSRLFTARLLAIGGRPTDAAAEYECSIDLLLGEGQPSVVRVARSELAELNRQLTAAGPSPTSAAGRLAAARLSEAS